MQVLGHRGSRVPGPENTVEAVDAALGAGADGVEIDVRRSADGDLVCVHDARLSRPAGRAVIRQSTAALRARGIPLLDEIIDVWAGRGRLVCEIKNQPGQPDFDAPRERTARALVEALRARGYTGPRPAVAELDAGAPGVTVSSFDWFAIEAVRDAELAVATAFLTMPRMSVGGGLGYVRAARHAELHAHTSAVLGSADAAIRARQAGVRLVTWTVTTTDAARALHDAGVAGIICDDPVEVRRALAAEDPNPPGGHPAT
ncbi:Glycerophosphoryl diester phosphodiesterase [Frankia canadensis]|uniref:Glycerophosphoryl diester phosphodiesterase n=1 Tax=Frankia canadensis TaxID=1836972 RepID=A0A2I2KIK0_9ACTN|nr:glycerophosphodiester phosphodiesterase [Frankia canadensis]SNQ45459.1 Glycerophosphoryl diester phosphodiesterase [Frankia canadensis]SOU52749.1 Glycerophosphoryl diester phosphodiesterase [Frankia canadensis]